MRLQEVTMTMYTRSKGNAFRNILWLTGVIVLIAASLHYMTLDIKDSFSNDWSFVIILPIIQVSAAIMILQRYVTVPLKPKSELMFGIFILAIASIHLISDAIGVGMIFVSMDQMLISYPLLKLLCVINGLIGFSLIAASIFAIHHAYKRDATGYYYKSDPNDIVDIPSVFTIDDDD